MLYVIRLLDNNGNFKVITDCDISRISGLNVFTDTFVDGDTTYWKMKIENNTDYTVESIDYPCVSIPDGDYKVFVPYTEGCVLHRLPECDYFKELRDGIDNFMYPHYVSMQYLSYFNDTEGLYFAAHDVNGVPKCIKAFKLPDGEKRLSIRSFFTVEPHTSKSIDYDIVTSKTEGGWYSAAELYRDFIENSNFPLPPKVAEDKSLPKWYHESPVVVVYPPRSVRGNGYYGPNEFYPYENGIKYLDELSEAFDSKVMGMLAYWEGSAPWAPPYNWPPYGDVESFLNFVKLMHERGNTVGLYGSGLNWTDKSLLVDEYDKTAERNDEVMCAKPNGSLCNNGLPGIRTGSNMCPSCKDTQDIAKKQAKEIEKAGVDFFQLFDQDIGGLGCPCYSKAHNHPPVFGVWQVEEIKRLDEYLSKHTSLIIGTESCAADIFMKYLRFNDLRYNLNAAIGRSVPAYEFVTHEYATNFMGNQCDYDRFVPYDKNPDSFIFRLAYSFVAGDLLTVTMKSGGELHWSWGMSWLIPGPNRRDIITCIRNFNALRKGKANPYLAYGRMLRPYPIKVSGDSFVLHRADGIDEIHSYVQTSLWKAPDGSIGLVCANFSREHRKVTPEGNMKIKIIYTHDGTLEHDASMSFIIPPFTAACVITSNFTI